MASGTDHLFLYRVLRPDEDPAQGIVAEDPFSSTSISDHVAYGTRYCSKYISTCADRDTAIDFAEMGLQHGDPSPKRIVTIDVEKLKKVPGIRIIDLTNDYMLQLHCGENDRALRFASNWEEVLVTGKIPASCIVKVDKIE